MKKLATILSVSALAVAAYGQGTVNFVNSTTTLARTNSAGLGGTAGNTAAAAGGFYYGVFTASSTVTTIDGSLQGLLGPAWTFTGLYGTNTVATSGGRFTGGANVATTTGWAPGQTNSFLVVGWSSNLGHDWAQISARLAGAALTGGVWDGAALGSGVTGTAFLGASLVSFGAAGGGTAGLPAFSLFGTGPVGQGNPLTTGFDLFVVNVPEPSTFALAGLGAAALLIFRRRK